MLINPYNYKFDNSLKKTNLEELNILYAKRDFYILMESYNHYLPPYQKYINVVQINYHKEKIKKKIFTQKSLYIFSHYNDFDKYIQTGGNYLQGSFRDLDLCLDCACSVSNNITSKYVYEDGLQLKLFDYDYNPWNLRYELLSIDDEDYGYFPAPEFNNDPLLSPRYYNLEQAIFNSESHGSYSYCDHYSYTGIERGFKGDDLVDDYSSLYLLKKKVNIKEKFTDFYISLKNENIPISVDEYEKNLHIISHVPIIFFTVFQRSLASSVELHYDNKYKGVNISKYSIDKEFINDRKVKDDASDMKNMLKALGENMSDIYKTTIRIMLSLKDTYFTTHIILDNHPFIKDLRLKMNIRDLLTRSIIMIDKDTYRNILKDPYFEKPYNI
jgi:hypothetical protein